MAKSYSFLENNSLASNLSTFNRGGKKITRSRNERGQFIRGDFERLNIYALIKQLMEISEDILYRVYTLVDYYVDKGNLIDSTACAVYVDGELVDDSIVFAEEHQQSIEPSRVKRQSYAFNSGMTGRDAILDWFNQNKILQHKNNTVELIVVAAMHYGHYLETGSYGGRKLRVISGVADEIESMIWKAASEAGYAPSWSKFAGYSKM